MRGVDRDPPIVGARRRNIYLDTRICQSDSDVEGRSESNVQRRSVNCGASNEYVVQGPTCGSESAAHESQDTHYLLRDIPETGIGVMGGERSRGKEILATRLILPDRDSVHRVGTCRNKQDRAHV